AALPSLMRREAAVLMEPGMGVTREAVASTLEHALAALLRHLESANIEHVAAEAAHAVPFKTLAFDGEPREVALCGAIDLLLVDAAGREIVVDVKWGGEDRRGEELAQNRSLQLATYSYLRYVAGAGARMPISAGRRGARRRSAERNLELALELPRRWPEQAYFIVTTGNILARDTRVFPDAVVFAPETAESTERLWARIGRSIDWRWAQLSAGDIEVNARGTQPDEGSAAPDDALAVQRDPDGYDDFTWLTGWEEGA
ncbi:MAG TPA: hypothetical protein VFS15_20920, partial [Kofleriaceae bacterium]|nr:hypothetical protein [Kofleriaceae bacterium]